MKKTISALLLVCTVCSAFWGCAAKSQSASSSSDKSWDTVRAARKLVVGVESNFAPISFYDENQKLSGFGVETATEVGKDLSVTVEFKPVPLAQAETALESREIDCFWSDYQKTAQNDQTADFSFSYMKSGQVILCPAKAAVQNLADLKNQRIGVKDGSGGQQAIEDSTAFKECLAGVVTYKDYAEAKTSLDNKKISAVVMDQVAAEYYVKNQPDAYRILGKSENQPPQFLETGDYCVAFRSGDESLALKVKEQLSELAADGTLSKLSKKWFGSDLTTSSSG